MKFGIVRWGYSLFSLFICYLAYKQSTFILGDTPSNFEMFSYIGIVATIVALVVTVFEVIHNVNVSRSIKDEASIIFNRVKTIEDASTISECLSALDDLNSAIGSNDFKSALKTFQFFRKLNAKTSQNINEATSEWKLNSISDLELEIMSATHSNEEAPLTPIQKKKMTRKVLVMKQFIEESNPAKMENKNATS